MISKVPNPPPDSIFSIDLKPLKAAHVKDEGGDPTLRTTGAGTDRS